MIDLACFSPGYLVWAILTSNILFDLGVDNDRGL